MPFAAATFDRATTNAETPTAWAFMFIDLRGLDPQTTYSPAGGITMNKT
jgi:hypothetical protein